MSLTLPGRGSGTPSTHQQLLALPLPLGLGLFTPFPQGAQVLLGHFLEAEQRDPWGICPVGDREGRAAAAKMAKFTQSGFFLELEPAPLDPDFRLCHQNSPQPAQKL